jgi:1-acyl-sn-glycerol-3-phosphate acyltransferase
MQESVIEEDYLVIHEEVQAYLKDIKKCDNIYRRKLYSRIELLKLDVEEVLEKLHVSQRCDDLLNKLTQLSKSVPIIPVQRPVNIFTQLEIVIRFLGVAGMFVLAGTIIAPLILIIRVFDVRFNKDPFNFVSENLKKLMLSAFLYLAGIELHVQGVDNEVFIVNPRVLLSFTHASNLDGFFVALTCPIRQMAFGKKELFLAPFFAWISLAIGGIPVDRGNRARAVNALKISVSHAKHSNSLCIAIAPEGTRSTTGQLLPYKKGAFYLAEDLNAPIVPLLIFGAFDLYPVGSWVNSTGIVTVRYLPPIFYTDQSSIMHSGISESVSKAQFLREVRYATFTMIVD